MIFLKIHSGLQCLNCVNEQEAFQTIKLHIVNELSHAYFIYKTFSSTEFVNRELARYRAQIMSYLYGEIYAVKSWLDNSPVECGFIRDAQMQLREFKNWAEELIIYYRHTYPNSKCDEERIINFVNDYWQEEKEV